MTRLFYNDSILDCEPPVDISPLILQLYRGKKILALCPREGILYRIKTLPNESKFGCQIDCVGWWELDSVAYSNLILRLDDYEAVVIVGKERVDRSFWELMEHFEALFKIESRASIVKHNDRIATN